MAQVLKPYQACMALAGTDSLPGMHGTGIETLPGLHGTGTCTEILPDLHSTGAETLPDLCGTGTKTLPGLHSTVTEALPGLHGTGTVGHKGWIQWPVEVAGSITIMPTPFHQNTTKDESAGLVAPHVCKRSCL